MAVLNKVLGSIPEQRRFHVVRIHALNGGTVCFALFMACAQYPSAFLNKDVWLSTLP